MTDNQQMITDLTDFIHANHEDELAPADSLYLMMLDQWQRLNRPGVTWADSESSQLYACYWRRMQTWHQHFMDARNQILVADAIGVPVMHTIFLDTLDAAQDDALDAVESLDAHGPRTVIPLNSFPRLLKMEVQRLAELLDTQELSPVDGQLLMEYWDAITALIDEDLEEK
ncbi:hypothetical protein [Limosilactobacillus kribbianus]|uniref:hypothetical protein n=1 Tax=Limosilactobacillus kribbianus TaxID=2982695 RepID=UPI002264F8B1|nr:hypothetical protein [Limosilactobacillus kribbianus]